MTHTHTNHLLVIARVDKLIDDFFNPNITLSIEQISEQLSLYYQPMTEIYDDQYEYTDTIDWFLGACYHVSGCYYPNEILWNHEMTLKFVEALSWYLPQYMTAKLKFALQEQRNSKSLSEYMGYYLDKYSRVLIVRVDLKIQAQYVHKVDIEAFHGYMEKLRTEIGNKRGCFEYLRGHAWAIEQGVKNGGLHCHLLLIYNGDKRQKDWFIGDAVGKRWVEITEDLGWCHNGNTPERKRGYERQGKLGIGMIHRNNSLEVHNAIHTALYLTRPDKFNQRLKVWLPGMRTFGHGLYNTPKRRGIAS